jgi:hypothetical protein
MTSNRSRNHALVRFVALPLIFLTVALLGGLRVTVDEHSFMFVAPPLITLLLALMLMSLFVRGHLIKLHAWLASDQAPLTNASHVLTLLALYFASAQAFNSVLPEKGLLYWLFSFFFLWTLWNNQFSLFDARRLLHSLAVLFGTAFVLKHMLLASLYAPEGGFLKKLAGALLEGISLGTLDTQAFAPATGYIAFFTLALYVAGLILLMPAPETETDEAARHLIRDFQRLTPIEQSAARAAIKSSGPVERRAQLAAPKIDEDEAIDAELSEETIVRPKP